MSRVWKAKFSRDYDRRNYASILSEYSSEDLNNMLYEGVDHIHIKNEDGEEVERLITEEERNLLCSIMYSTVVSIRWGLSPNDAINTGEYTADILFDKLLHIDLQGYLSYYNPMWEFLDYLATKDNVFEIVDGVLVQYHGRERSVAVPDGVTSIGNTAFMWNTWLEDVIIPDGVSVIGKEAFKGCKNLVDIIIPNSVTKFDTSAFSYCKSLVSVIIPNGVTEIGNGAFEDCDSLESVVIPESVKEIKSFAFAGCENLSCVLFPESVPKIGDSAFYDCPFQP